MLYCPTIKLLTSHSWSTQGLNLIHHAFPDKVEIWQEMLKKKSEFDKKMLKSLNLTGRFV
jgi:hypothetical protein